MEQSLPRSSPAATAPPGGAHWFHRVRKLPAVLWGRWTLRRASTVGRWTRVRGWPRIVNHGTMVIGSRVRLVSTPVRSELVCQPGGNLYIGDGTFINSGASIGASMLIQIGKGCQIGNQCIMLDNDYHGVDLEARTTRPSSAPIILGDNVWLGVRVTILKGVTIGEGAVIGAGSIVTHDIPPRSLAVGVPARVIRTF